MASITLSQTTLNIPNTSGTTVINATFNDCDPGGATLSEGLVNGRVTTSAWADTIGLSWDANNSDSPRYATLVVDGWDRSTASVVTATCQITQSGNTPAVMSIQGPGAINGNSQLVTLTASCTLPGNIGVAINGLNPWVTVSEVRQTSSYSAMVTLSFSENTGASRSVTVTVFSDVQNPPPYQVSADKTITQGTYTPPEPEGSEFYYSPSSVNVDYRAGTYTTPVPVMKNVSNVSILHMSGSLIQSAVLDPTNKSIAIVYNENTSSGVRDATIIVEATGTQGTIIARFYIYQGAYSFQVNPIWKTTTVDISGKAYVGYTVSTDGYPVYSGRAYLMPGDENISFELNEIVRDYVDNYFWWRAGYQTPSGWNRTFTLEAPDAGITADYMFTKDWSYDNYKYSSSLVCLNDPIIPEVPAGAYVPICVFSPTGNSVVRFHYNPGYSHIVANTTTLDNQRQVRWLFTSTSGYKYGYDGKPGIYQGVDACSAPYAIYYENAYGGIDCMPINGTVTASDKITSYTTKNAVRVPTRDFAYRRYLNDDTKTWELKTRWLTDEQSAKMHHLIESTMVYLYDVAADELIPVVIDENSLTYKTFRNQQRKLYNYTFKVKESQNKIRK